MAASIVWNWDPWQLGTRVAPLTMPPSDVDQWPRDSYWFNDSLEFGSLSVKKTQY